MNWTDVANAVKKYAPGAQSLLNAASLIPGVGAITGPAALAVGALSKALGAEPTPDAIVNAISQDPNAALKLHQAELDFQLQSREQDIKELQTHLADVQSARSRQVETEKVTGKKDVNLYALAWMVVTGFFSLLIFLLFVAIPEDQNGVVFMLFGSLATGFGQVLQYFFGSSKGSAEKTGLLSTKSP